MLKHLPLDSLKPLQKHLLYSKQPVYYAQTAYDRRNFNGSVPTGATALTAARKKTHTTDLNLEKRISLFKNQLKNEFV